MMTIGSQTVHVLFSWLQRQGSLAACNPCQEPMVPAAAKAPHLSGGLGSCSNAVAYQVKGEMTCLVLLGESCIEICTSLQDSGWFMGFLSSK
jgi:hypothetical protein